MAKVTKKHLLNFMTSGADRGNMGINTNKHNPEALFDDLALFEAMRPFLKMIQTEAKDLAKMGDVENFVKKAANYGFLQQLYIMHTTDNDKLKYEIAKYWQDRYYGKPTEKHVSVKIPIDQMDEKQLDAIISSRLRDPINKEILKNIIDVTPTKEKK